MEKVLKTEQDYEEALKRLDLVFDAPEGTQESELCDLLVLLIKDYEDRNVKLDPPTPIEAIRFRLDQLGVGPSYLESLDGFGHSGRVSEVLNGKRDLSKTMMRSLHHKLGIPYESLFSEPVIKEAV